MNFMLLSLNHKLHIKIVSPKCWWWFSVDPKTTFTTICSSLPPSGKVIERVTECFYLGFWINENVTFKFHVSILLSTLRKTVGYFYKKFYFRLHCRKMLIDQCQTLVDMIYIHVSAVTLKPPEIVIEDIHVACMLEVLMDPKIQNRTQNNPTSVLPGPRLESSSVLKRGPKVEKLWCEK